MRASRYEPTPNTCPTIDEIISLSESVREDNSKLRQWGNDLLKDYEELEQENNELKEEIQGLESKILELENELSLCQTED